MDSFTPDELRLIITLAEERRREYMRAAGGKETENSRFTDGIFHKAVAMLQEATAPRHRRTAPPLTPSRPREDGI